MGKRRNRSKAPAIEPEPAPSLPPGSVWLSDATVTQPVTGHVWNGELVLVDSGNHALASGLRGPDDAWCWIGNWDADAKSVQPLPGHVLAAASDTPVQPGTAPSTAPSAGAAAADIAGAAASGGPAPASECPSPRIDGAAVQHSFEVCAADHAETSPQAYEHIVPVAAAASPKGPAEMTIYDPYFCAGAVIRRLGRLGFPHVYNRNEDFYAVLASAALPEHDLLLTNPPYSADHVQKLLEYLQTRTGPWMALMPAYVAAKPEWASLCRSYARGQPRPFFIVPKKRYYYWTPKGMHAQAVSGAKRTHGGPRGVRTSPFVSMWFVYGGAQHVPMVAAAKEAAQQFNLQVCMTEGQLPKAAKPMSNAGNKRPRHA